VFPRPVQHGIGAGGQPPRAEALRLLPTQIQRFNGEDYLIWAGQLSMVFKKFKIWDVVTGERVQPTNPLDPDYDRFEYDNYDAATAIFNTLERKIQRIVAHHMSDSRKLWAYLEEVYQNQNLYTQIEYQARYHKFQWQAGHDMQTYIIEFNSLVEELRRHNVAPSERELTLKLLAHLPAEFNIEKKFILQDPQLTVDKATARLLSEAQARKIADGGSPVTVEANYARGGRGGRGRGGRGRGGGRGGAPPPKPVEKRKCYTCGDVGHRAADCPKGGRDVSGNKRYLCFHCHSDQHKIAECPIKAQKVEPAVSGTGQTA